MTDAYPLRWPEGWPRTKNRRGAEYAFKVSAEKAVRSLHDELKRLGATHVVVSTNCRLRADGNPYYEDLVRRNFENPGAAIYFQLNGRAMSMAQDAYDAPFGNIRSLALAIEAMRAIERHGGGHMMQRSFDGFAALPPPGGSTGYQKKPWRDVLKFTAGHEALDAADQRILVEAKYKALARELHPDAPGGSADAMAELNIAIEDAREELK